MWMYFCIMSVFHLYCIGNKKHIKNHLFCEGEEEGGSSIRVKNRDQSKRP